MQVIRSVAIVLTVIVADCQTMAESSRAHSSIDLAVKNFMETSPNRALSRRGIRRRHGFPFNGSNNGYSRLSDNSPSGSRPTTSPDSSPPRSRPVRQISGSPRTQTPGRTDRMPSPEASSRTVSGQQPRQQPALSTSRSGSPSSSSSEASNLPFATLQISQRPSELTSPRARTRSSPRTHASVEMNVPDVNSANAFTKNPSTRKVFHRPASPDTWAFQGTTHRQKASAGGDSMAGGHVQATATGPRVKAHIDVQEGGSGYLQPFYDGRGHEMLHYDHANSPGTVEIPEHQGRSTGVVAGVIGPGSVKAKAWNP